MAGVDLVAAGEVIVRTAIVYLFLVVVLRLSGKREVGQMSILELIVVLLISDAVQNSMVGSDTTLVGGLIAVSTLLLMDFGLRAITSRSRRLRRAIEGEPRLLVRDGRLLSKALREEGVDPEAVRTAVRNHGVASIADVRLAVLETDGSVSVIPKSNVPESADLPPTRAAVDDRVAGGCSSRPARRSERRRLVQHVGLEEREDPFVGVPPVLPALPAVAFFLVPVDFVAFSFDLERFHHPLGHERDDPFVLAPVEDQQRGLDAFGAIHGRAATVSLDPARVVGRAHHLVQVETAHAVAVAVALGDLRITEEVHAGPPQLWLVHEGA